MSDSLPGIAKLALVAGGSFIGGPLGGIAGGIAGNLLFPGPDPPTVIGPRLGDLQVQVSAYGNPIPRIFGVYRVAGNIIWNSDIREIAHSTQSSSGGKGGAPQQTSISFTYEVDLAISLCVGPIAGIKRIWANDQLWFDYETPSHGRGINAKIYLGSTTQLPDPLIEADKGVGNVSAHRGLAYIMMRQLDLAPFQNAPPTFHFEVFTNGTPFDGISEVTDTASLGRILIDPNTGFVWAARQTEDKVLVFNCVDGNLTKVCELSHPDPTFISFQPAFTSVQQSFGGEPEILNIEARVWVGSHLPDAFGTPSVASYATDGSCRRLDTINDPFNGSVFCWPGFVFVNRATINEIGPNLGPGPQLMVGSTNGNCFLGIAFSLTSLAPGGGVLVGENVNVAAGVDWTSDAVQGGGFVYVVDVRGQLWKAHATKSAAATYVIDKVVQASLSFTTLQNSVTYDPEEEMIYTKTGLNIGGPYQVAKWTTNLDLVWSFQIKNAGDNFYNPTRIRYHEGNGDVLTVGKSTASGFFDIVKRIDKLNGGFILAEEFETATTRTFDDFQPFPGQQFAVGTSSGAVVKFPLSPVKTPAAPTLAFVVGEICKMSNTLVDIDLNVTDLTSDTVRGYAIATRAPLRNALEPLLNAYFVDPVESDDKIKFVKRGNASVATIGEKELNVYRDPGTGGSPLEEFRTQENELPNHLDVRFINADVDYKIGVQYARRLIGDSEQLRTVTYPIVFTPPEAKVRADVLMHNAWFERNNKKFTLGRKYLRLDPTDVITITSPDQGQIDVRLNTIAFSMPQLLELQASEEDPTIYTGFTFPSPIGLQPQPPLQTFPPVILIVLDIPTLRDIDDGVGVYTVAYALGGGFSFAQVLHSNDGIAYGPATVISNEAKVGFAQDALSWEGSFI